MGNFIFGGGSKSLNKGGLLTCRGRQALPLQITLQPQSKTVDEYALATFSCEVSGGTAPYSYQWKKNGANVGTNSANLSLTAAAADNSASITVVVTDSSSAVITSSAAVLGVTSYVYRFDGLTQYASASSAINVITGDFEYEITFRRTGSGGGFVVSSHTGSNYGLNIYTSGDFDANTGSISVFGTSLMQSAANKRSDTDYRVVVTYLSGVMTMRVNGAVEASANVALPPAWLSSTASAFAAKGGGTFRASGEVKLFRLTDTSKTIAIPLNNKSQGANQLATVGSINATIVNYNAAGWVAI